MVEVQIIRRLAGNKPRPKAESYVLD